MLDEGLDDGWMRFKRWLDDGWMRYLIQRAHGEDGPIVSLDGLHEAGVFPDVNVSVGGPREDQVLGPTVTG